MNYVMLSELTVSMNAKMFPGHFRRTAKATDNTSGNYFHIDVCGNGALSYLRSCHRVRGDTVKHRWRFLRIPRASQHYHSFQNHYSHEITILDFWGDTASNVCPLQLYNFLVLLTRTQLQEIIPHSDFQQFLTTTVAATSGVLSRHLGCEMKSPHLVDFS